MTGKRKRYSAEFKAKVAMEALRGELTTSQLATKHGVHQTMIGDWKRQAMEGLVSVFSSKAEAKEGIREEELEKLHAKIGQLVVERGAAADDQDGVGADLPASAHDGAASRAPDLPLPTARLGGGPSEPGLVCRYHVHPDAARVSVFGRGDGLGDQEGAGLAGVEHDGRGVLRRRAAGGPGPVRPSGDL